MNSLFSKSIKAGKITYYFDVKEAKNQSKYLTITASQPSESGEKKYSRRSINVFSSAADGFKEALQEAIAQLK